MTEQELSNAIARHLTPQTLRESVLTTDFDADWEWAARHWCDFLAQELLSDVTTSDVLQRAEGRAYLQTTDITARYIGSYAEGQIDADIANLKELDRLMTEEKLR
jgi:hypothetical protein